MVRYAVLLYLPAPGGASDTPPEEVQAHARFNAQVEEMGGKITSPQALMGDWTATSLRGDVITDGPFVDSEEVLSGVFVLEARDLDHALAMAKLNPATWLGGVEIRPLRRFE
jgi:hypothetical protein